MTRLLQPAPEELIVLQNKIESKWFIWDVFAALPTELLPNRKQNIVGGCCLDIQSKGATTIPCLIVYLFSNGETGLEPVTHALW